MITVLLISCLNENKFFVYMKFEAFTVVKIHIVILWVMRPVHWIIFCVSEEYAVSIFRVDGT